MAQIRGCEMLQHSGDAHIYPARWLCVSLFKRTLCAAQRLAIHILAVGQRPSRRLPWYC